MIITTQESAESLKSILHDLQKYVEEIQWAYVKQSLHTIRDWLLQKDTVNIDDVRKIKINFEKAYENQSLMYRSVRYECDQLKLKYGIQWDEQEKNNSDYTWESTYVFSKNGREVMLVVETTFGTTRLCALCP